MKEIKKSFRSTYGLDAAGSFVENVQTPNLSKEHIHHGLNVDFFINETTIQDYDSTRSYKKGFIISYKSKLFYSKFDIDAPAGNFSYNSWEQVRTDIQSKLVTSGSLESPTLISSGSYISVDTNTNEVFFKLPDDPAEGDSIVIKDVGGNLGLKKAEIVKARHPIHLYGSAVDSYVLTRPYNSIVVLFIGGVWRVNQESVFNQSRFIDQSKVHQSQVGDCLYGDSLLGNINVTLPKYANTGDVVRLYDLSGKDSNHKFIVNAHPDNKLALGPDGKLIVDLYTSSADFIFDSKSKSWKILDLDLREKLKVVSTDYTLSPHDVVMPFGPNFKDRKSIVLTLPGKSIHGAPVKISNIYLRPGQKVTIKPTDPESVIMFNKTLLEFQKRSERPTTQDLESLKELVIDGSTDTYNSLELAYVEVPGSAPNWVVSEYDPLIERVDPNYRQGLGVIALATQEQANVDKGKTPNKEVAITPETLANRTATETRQGILRTATLEEILLDFEVPHDKLTAITPYTLNARTPTEKRSGLVIIANQTEVNAGLIDNKFVSPKKLHARTATETRTGIASLTKSGGVPTIESRDKPGTMVYDFTDHKTIVTPKTLSELRSTHLGLGLLFLANEAEVISGKSQDFVKFPVAVTPEELHKKTATLDRIGFTQTASQDEVNTNVDNFKYVTPKTLSGRVALTNRTGIAKLATQKEFDDGSTNTISTPSVIKDRFKNASRFAFKADSGLVLDGSLWDTLNHDILEASLVQRGTLKLASGEETNNRVVDNKAVTPLSLASVLSTESNSGLIKVSTLNELIEGVSPNTAVSPKNLFAVKNHKTAWKSNTKTYGFVRIATVDESFVGNNLAGSTVELKTYDELNAVSPLGLNTALTNFLPKTAIAADSSKLDNRLPGEYTVKSLNEIVAGKWTFTNEQKFNSGIVVSKPSTLDSISLVGADQLTIDPKSNAVESSIKLNTKSKKIWDISTSAEGLNISYEGTPAVKILPKVIEVNNATVKGITSLVVSDSILLKGSKYLYSTGTNSVVLGTKTLTTSIEIPDANNFKVSDTAGSHKIVTTKNLIEETGKNFLNIKGGTLTGKLNISNSSVNPSIKESAPEKLISDNGLWTSNIVTESLYSQYPPSAGSRVINDNGTTTYKDATHKQGSLFNASSSKSNGLQVWAPADSNKKFIRSSKVDGSWGEFDEILTTNNLPKPEEIGAISSEGLVYENIKVQGWIQIGNLRIRPNPATKSVDFIWVDEE